MKICRTLLSLKQKLTMNINDTKKIENMQMSNCGFCRYFIVTNFIYSIHYRFVKHHRVWLLYFY